MKLIHLLHRRWIVPVFLPLLQALLFQIDKKAYIATGKPVSAFAYVKE